MTDDTLVRLARDEAAQAEDAADAAVEEDLARERITRGHRRDALEGTALDSAVGAARGKGEPR